uniref:Uncharacterized protein n=2 Tax=Heterosigma akashiwo TaxID=2829 RepID=A0A7S3XPZ0_HETAK|mmetsp:Transcript_1686/g.2586  ORF Transcript_1686/g.2586 Transcript_1686/m.2586 type:complete len:199 (-) Transcript_1686:167-763(-)
MKKRQKMLNSYFGHEDKQEGQSREWNIFCDLDGVLVDFDSGVQQITGKMPSEMHPKTMWPQLARAEDFYNGLSWMPDGKELWDRIQSQRPTILTGLPMGRWAEAQKRAWCARELGAGVPVDTCLSRDKWRRARPGAVLVDDRFSLQEKWVEAGGVFIHHQSTSQTIDQLTDLGILKYDDAAENEAATAQESKDQQRVV